jgi:DNA-directed RNA polymerase specialized sigma24 family protein
MTDRWLDRYEALSLDAQIVIDELCSRYEASLQAGEAPSLEAYLHESSVTDPAALLAELVAIDVTYRQRRGERPASRDYTGRFPAFAEVIAEVFAEDQSPTHIVSHPRVPGLPQALPAIAGHEVRGELGQGGMGVVLQGHDSAVGRAVARGCFPQLDDRDSLWRLLVTLTARKALRQLTHEQRQKRGGGTAAGPVGIYSVGPDDEAALVQVVGDEPTPDFAAQVAQEYRRLLDLLGDESLRQVALWKMEGYDNDEIAEMLACSRRTVARKLNAIRILWSKEPAP